MADISQPQEDASSKQDSEVPHQIRKGRLWDLRRHTLYFPYIIAHFYPKSVMGRRRFARCIVEMGDCRRRRRA